jgi:metallo-beta-lactamase family protein
MKLSFHGADRDVTGSCHLVEVAGRRILIDCGMHQGGRTLEEQNAEPLGFDPKTIDHVLLTHAHLDHCGRLPLVVKQGYRGEILTTAATRELAQLVLLDAAHLQDEESQHRQRHDRRRGKQATSAPLYSLVDATNCLHHFGRDVEYGKPVPLGPGVQATFLDAGHILGSASILIEAEENGKRRSVVFSGDLGNAGRPLLRPPNPPAAAEIIVMESTYGNRSHRPYKESVEEFYTAIIESFTRGGNIIIPTFALERAQELLFLLRQGVENGRLRAAASVFLDSPMAISATEIFEHHPEACAPDVAAMLQKGDDPFHLAGLHMTRGRAESVAINNIRGGAVIMAGSGMCTGGRIRHHLWHNLWRPESSIVFVGYAAAGTLARQIIDGAREVTLFDEPVQVRASIHTINGFSAHADQGELLAWHQRIGGSTTTFLVHGEEQTMQELAKKLPKTRVEMPRLHESFEV